MQKIKAIDLMAGVAQKLATMAGLQPKEQGTSELDEFIDVTDITE